MPLSRRKLFAGAGAGALAFLATSCGKKQKTKASDMKPDLALEPVRLSAGIEVLAVNAYTTTANKVAKNTIGATAPALADFITTALSRHKAHLDAVNKVLSASGETIVKDPDQRLNGFITAKLQQAKNMTDAAKVLITVEQSAAATYQSMAAKVADPAAAKLAASIEPIDMQHAAVLAFFTGQYPIQLAFSSSDLPALT